MSISGILSSTLSKLDSTSNNTLTQMMQAWKTLESSLKSGDLDAAKTAFATIQKLHQAQQNSSNAPETSQMDSDMEALGKALESGDLSAAQEAFATVKADMKKNPPPPPPNVDGKQGADSKEAFVLELLQNLNSTGGSSGSTSDTLSELLDELSTSNSVDYKA